MSQVVKLEMNLDDAMLNRLEARIANAIDKALSEGMGRIGSQRRKLTRMEAAKKLRISPPTLDKLLREGKLRCQRVGKRVLIDEQDLEEYLNRPR